MTQLNDVTLVGYVGRDFKVLSYSKFGKQHSYLVGSVCINGKDSSTFVDITIFEGDIKNLASKLLKGTAVRLCGRLVNRVTDVVYHGKETKFHSLGVVVNYVAFMNPVSDNA